MTTAASFLHPSVRPLQQAGISSRPRLKALFIGRNGTSWPGHDGLACCLLHRVTRDGKEGRERVCRVLSHGVPFCCWTCSVIAYSSAARAAAAEGRRYRSSSPGGQVRARQGGREESTCAGNGTWTICIPATGQPMYLLYMAIGHLVSGENGRCRH